MGEEHAALNTLEEKTQEIRSILSTSSDTVLLLADSGGQVIHANGAGLSSLMGFELEEVVDQMTLRQLLSWPDLVCLNPRPLPLARTVSVTGVTKIPLVFSPPSFLRTRSSWVRACGR